MNRIPPQATDIEESLLGSMLIERSTIPIVMDSLKGTDFYDTRNQTIFNAIQKLYINNTTVDLLTMEEELKDSKIEFNYLADLTRSVVSSSYAEDYCKIVKNKSILRDLIQGMSKVTSFCYEPNTEHLEVINTLGSLIDLSTPKNGEMVDIGEAMQNALMEIDRIQTKGDVIGYRTGLSRLDYFINSIQTKKFYLIGARPSMGKASKISSLVKTEKGWDKIGNLKVGDKISDIRGNVQTVEGVYPQGKLDMYKFTFSDGRSTTVSKDHLWTVYNRKWKGSKTVTTAKLIEYLEKPSYKNRIWIDTPITHGAKKWEYDIDPWIIGFLIGDGSLTDNVKFSTGNEFCLDKIKRLLPERFKVNHAGKYDYRIIEPEIRGNSLKQLLIDLGLQGKRAEDKFIPEIFFELNVSDRLKFVQGLMDSDGWAEIDGSIRYSTSSERLANDFVNIARSLGAITSLSEKIPKYTYKGEKKTGLKHYIIGVMVDTPKDFFTRPSRKKRANNDRKRRLTISSIEQDGKDECVCIKVSSKDSLYIVDDYVVTHNTAFALSLMRRFAKDGVGVGILSLETSANSISFRLLSSVSGIQVNEIIGGRLNEEKLSKLMDAGSKLSELNIAIDDSASLTDVQLKAKCRRLVSKHKCNIIFLDYLQLLTSDAPNREREIAQISRTCKIISKEMDVAVIALAQLSRAVEGRSDKRPMLSDLRDSGQIEQDADVVMFLYRPEYYDITVTNSGESTDGLLEVIVAKQKDGATGVASLHFDKERMSVENRETNYNYLNEQVRF